MEKTNYTVKEAAQIMGTTAEFLRTMIEQGKIPGATFIEGKRHRYYIPARPLEQWLGIKERSKA